MTTEVLGRRTLNRTLLLRQGLLKRSPAGPAETVEHLVGTQAQVPENPYVALWSRLEGFEPSQLSDLVAVRQRDALPRRPLAGARGPRPRYPVPPRRLDRDPARGRLLPGELEAHRGGRAGHAHGRPLRRPSRRPPGTPAAIAAEGEALLRLLAADAPAHRVRFEPEP